MSNDEIINPMKDIIIHSHSIKEIEQIHSIAERKEMQPADYRLVRSQIKDGIMISIKRNVLPKTMEYYFSYWLYGERKSTEQISIHLPRSIPCLVCSDENIKSDDFSLLTVDTNLFLRCLLLLDNQQLTILYSLLDDDQQSYQYAIRQQYHDYKQRLLDTSKRKLLIIFVCFICLPKKISN